MRPFFLALALGFAFSAGGFAAFFRGRRGRFRSGSLGRSLALFLPGPRWSLYAPWGRFPLLCGRGPTGRLPLIRLGALGFIRHPCRSRAGLSGIACGHRSLFRPGLLSRYSGLFRCLYGGGFLCRLLPFRFLHAGCRQFSAYRLLYVLAHRGEDVLDILAHGVQEI